MSVEPVEIVMSHDDAERITRRITLMAGTIREGVEKLYDLVQQAKDGNAHVALGYPSWTAYLADTLGKNPIQLPREERREIVGYLSGEGMSTRAIAPIVGVSDVQVHRDIRASRQVLPDVAPATTADPLPPFDPRTGELLDGTPTAETHSDVDEVEESSGGAAVTPYPAPGSVTGLDGKSYPKSAPKPTPRRSPLPDAFWRATYDLTKKAESLTRLVEDDRFPSNAEKVATANRSDLLRAIDALQRIVDRLPSHDS